MMNKRFLDPLSHLVRQETVWKNGYSRIARPLLCTRWKWKSITEHDFKSKRTIAKFAPSSVQQLPSAKTLSELIQPVRVLPEKGEQGVRRDVPELDKDKVNRLLDITFSEEQLREKVKKELSIGEEMLSEILSSFKTYCLAPHLPSDLHAVLYDITERFGPRTNLVAFLFEHSFKVYPHLNVMEDLKYLCTTNMINPVNWYPKARKMKRKIIYHCGPTNSGKTHAALERFREAKTGVYLAPFRLLAIECFTSTNKENVPCDLLTGERKYFIKSENDPANHRSCTIELLDFSKKYEVAVIDEIQMIGDYTRGGNWTQALLGVLADEIHLCGGRSGLDIVKNIVENCGDSFEVRNYKRKNGLVVLNKELGSLENVRAGDCIVCFQVKDLFNVGTYLTELGKKCALMYGALPPGLKIHQSNIFNNADDPCNILVATDAVGMGLNLSIKRIIFYSMEKYSAIENKDELIERFTTKKQPLNTTEAQQIAGRAGRYGGQYEKEGGEVTALTREDLVTLHQTLRGEEPMIQKAGLMIRDDIIEKFASFLTGMPFSRMLMLFVACCETGSQYFLCDTSQMLKRAMLMDPIDISLRKKLVFCQAPLRMNSLTPFSAEIFVKMAKEISQGQFLTLKWFLAVTHFSASELDEITDFEKALEIFHLTDIFLRLSFEFPYFRDVELMRGFRIELDKGLQQYIEKNYTAITQREVVRKNLSDDFVKSNTIPKTFEAKPVMKKSDKRWKKKQNQNKPTSEIDTDFDKDSELAQIWYPSVENSMKASEQTSASEGLAKTDISVQTWNTSEDDSMDSAVSQTKHSSDVDTNSYQSVHSWYANDDDNAPPKTDHAKKYDILTSSSDSLLDSYTPQYASLEMDKGTVNTHEKSVENDITYKDLDKNMDIDINGPKAVVFDESEESQDFKKNVDNTEVKSRPDDDIDDDRFSPQPEENVWVDRGMMGFQYFIKKRGLGVAKGGQKWRGLSESQRTHFIEEAEKVANSTEFMEEAQKVENSAA